MLKVLPVRFVTFEKSRSLEADRKRDKGVKQEDLRSVVDDNSHQHFLLYRNRERKNGGERKTRNGGRISREEARNFERSSSFNGRPASAKGQLVTVPVELARAIQLAAPRPLPVIPITITRLSARLQLVQVTPCRDIVPNLRKLPSRPMTESMRATP